MNILTQLKEKIVRYIDVQLKLVKLGFIERTSSLLSYVIFSLILLFIVFCIILFLGFGLTELFVLAGLSKALSFFITLGIYLLLLILVFLLRQPITRFFASEIISVMTDEDDEDNDEDKRQ